METKELELAIFDYLRNGGLRLDETKRGGYTRISLSLRDPDTHEYVEIKWPIEIVESTHNPGHYY